MGQWKEIKIEDINRNSIKMIGTDWMLITAKDNDKVNTMTASCGAFGVMWGKNVAYIVIRKDRYTKQFVDNADTFSLTFFPEEYKKELRYLGSKSGRDEDKIGKTGLTLDEEENTPFFKEADTVLFCKKLFNQEMSAEFFLDKEILKAKYADGFYHTVYIAEITKALIKE